MILRTETAAVVGGFLMNVIESIGLGFEPRTLSLKGRCSTVGSQSYHLERAKLENVPDILTIY